MKVAINELRHAVKIMEDSTNACIIQNVIRGLKEIIEQTKTDTIRKDVPESWDTADLIDRNHYLADILWQSQDIEDELVCRGFKGTEKNIDEVIERIDTDELEDCSRGWEKGIYPAIDKAEEDGVLKEMPED